MEVSENSMGSRIFSALAVVWQHTFPWIIRITQSKSKLLLVDSVERRFPNSSMEPIAPLLVHKGFSYAFPINLKMSSLNIILTCFLCVLWNSCFISCTNNDIFSLQDIPFFFLQLIFKLISGNTDVFKEDTKQYFPLIRLKSRTDELWHHVISVDRYGWSN